MPTITEIALTVIASAFTAFTTIVVARRRHSGNIRTSEAETLWNESRAIRREQRRDLDNLYKRVRDLEEEKTECLQQVTSLRNEVATLRKMT